MVTILAQNLFIYNITNFSHISYLRQEDEQKNERHLVVLDDAYVLGEYSIEQIPNVLFWIAREIGNIKDSNTCLFMPREKVGDADAENGGVDSNSEIVGEVSTEK